MATGPGPRQRFPSNIIRISFAAAGGLVYFHWSWKSVSGTATVPAAVDPLFDFVNSFVDTPNLHLVSDSPVARLAVPMSKDEEKRSVPVRNPVTISMLPHYSMWTPENAKTVYRKNESMSVPGGDLYFVDAANWVLVYNHHETSRETRVMSREAALAEFVGLIGSTGYEGLDASLMGVILPQYWDGFGLRDIPNFPDPLAFEIFAITPGWMWHSEPGTGATTTKSEGAANLTLNLAQLRFMTQKSHQKDKTLVFNIKIPKDKMIAAFEMSAQAITLKDGPRFDKKTQTYDFPVDAKLNPTWPEWATEKVTVSGTSGVGDHTIKVTITYAGRDNKGKDTPPKIEMEIDADVAPVVG
jgi:hypothetical protein